ncbi:hypothetical protein [Aeromonas veronii]|uniref:hypothetical protein n=1 Tax=Aeromonas veronii TaxID=654 RepID=UPI003D1CA267
MGHSDQIQICPMVKGWQNEGVYDELELCLCSNQGQIMTETVFYYDWTFWSAFAAIAALIISLSPHIILLVRRPRLEVEVQSRIGVTHKVGNPNIWMFVSIRNTGGKKIKLKSLSINLKRGDMNCFLPSPNYYETISSQSPVLFIPRELKPGDYWEHGCNFVRELERNMEQNYRKAESALRADINTKRAVLPPNHPTPVIADSKLVDTLLNMFNEQFIWHPGEYTIELNIEAIPASASYRKKFRFTLFESDTDDLKAYAQDYKFGAGIYFHEPTHVVLSIPIYQSIDN